MYQKILVYGRQWLATAFKQVTGNHLTSYHLTNYQTKGGDIEMDKMLKPKIRGVNPLGFYWLIGLMAIGVIIGIPATTQATPGANVLITDNPAHKVIEVNPTNNMVEWEYGGTGILNYPNEAIPLTNGNILITDTYNGRIIEVTSDTKQIEWEYKPGSLTLMYPGDVRKCVDYTGTPTETLLITDFGLNKVIEITYPDGAVVWEFNAANIGGTGDYLFWEAEKRPGLGTPTYLITSRTYTGYAGNCVMEVERTGPTSGNIIWKYENLNDPRDADWLPCGNILITDTDNYRVIEVQKDGTVVWQWGPVYPDGTFTPYEATRIENGNTLVVGARHATDDNMDGIYPDTVPTEVVEVAPGFTVYWSYLTSETHMFVDVEEKGIINIAKIEYEDVNKNKMPKVFAGVVVPIYQPVIIGTPTIIATKTVTPTGPQEPGTTLTYAITVTNIGDAPAKNIKIIDQVPPGTVYVFDSATKLSSPDNTEYSHDGGMNYDTSQAHPVTHIRWTIDHLDAGEIRTVQFSVVIK